MRLEFLSLGFSMLCSTLHKYFCSQTNTTGIKDTLSTSMLDNFQNLLPVSSSQERKQLETVLWPWDQVARSAAYSLHQISVQVSSVLHNVPEALGQQFTYMCLFQVFWNKTMAIVLQPARALQPAAWNRVPISSPRVQQKSTGNTRGFKICQKSSGDIRRVERAKVDSALFIVFTGSSIQYMQSHNHAWDLRECLWLMDSWGPLYETASSPVLFSKSGVAIGVLSTCPGMAPVYFVDLLWFVLEFLLIRLPEMKASDTFIWSFDWCY